MTIMTTAAWERVADADELPPNGRKSIFIDDVSALLLRVGDDYFAIEDVCTHDGQPLTDGPVADEQITCPRHGARFDLRTGKPTCMPATEAVRTFAVRVEPDGIYVGPESAATQPSAANTVRPAPITAALTATSAAIPSPATSAAPTDVDDASIIEALRQVVDPELFVNIIDLGLVYAIQHDAGKVNVEMTLTSPACPAGPQIIQQSKSVVERLPGVSEVQIKLVMSPPWTPDRMTDEARDQLGFF
jgi:metal-sulfur cluster biosynthetic enzyme/nitrite reductase/ring-hydroxylating ferredoxin subunit